MPRQTGAGDENRLMGGAGVGEVLVGLGDQRVRDVVQRVVDRWQREVKVFS
jgi:hypothetical protein